MEGEFEYEQKRKIGRVSYSILYTICEEMMKTNSSFIIESNFTKDSATKISELLKKYHYKSITIKFDADLKILHRRFLEREKKSERHPGLVANDTFDDFENFKEVAEKAREFKIDGQEEIVIDTSDFSEVNWKEIDKKVKNKIKNI